MSHHEPYNIVHTLNWPLAFSIFFFREYDIGWCGDRLLGRCLNLMPSILSERVIGCRVLTRSWYVRGHSLWHTYTFPERLLPKCLKSHYYCRTERRVPKFGAF